MCEDHFEIEEIIARLLSGEITPEEVSEESRGRIIIEGQLPPDESGGL